MKETNKFDKLIGILSISVICIVAIVFVAIISNFHIAKGTYGVIEAPSIEGNDGYSLCPQGYTSIKENNVETSYCCPDGYYYADNVCYKNSIYAQSQYVIPGNNGVCEGFDATAIATFNGDEAECKLIYPTCIKQGDKLIVQRITDCYQTPVAKEKFYCGTATGSIINGHAVLDITGTDTVAMCCENVYGYHYTDYGSCMTDVLNDDLVHYYKKSSIPCFGDGYVQSGNLCIKDPSTTSMDKEPAQVVFHVNGTTKTVTCLPSNDSIICKIKATDVPSCSNWCEDENSDKSCADSSYVLNAGYASGTTTNYYCRGGSDATPTPSGSSPIGCYLVNHKYVWAASKPTGGALVNSITTQNSCTGCESGYSLNNTTLECTKTSSSSEPINPQTGMGAIVFAWIIGLFAICYSFWYFKRTSAN